MHKDASVGPSLTPNLLKLAPIEPRAIYESSAYRIFPSRTLLQIVGHKGSCDQRCQHDAFITWSVWESEARPVLPKAPGVLAKALKPRLVLIF